jgi:hypothetical protein
VRTDEGVAIRSEDVEPPTSHSVAPTPRSTEDAGPAAPGVVATPRAPIPPGAVTCSPRTRPAVEAVAQVSDPAAPRITVAVPDGWSVTPGTGDIGVRLNGPDGMSATVSIAKTRLDPAAAFTEYADRVMAVSPVSSVSVLPAELCGYSGQKLMGNWSDNPQQSVQFVDRIVHVRTDTDNYLVAVHSEAPAGTRGFDAAATVLTEDFTVGIP